MSASIITAAQAAQLIQDEWTITTGGFGSCGHPDVLTAAIKARFLETQTPRDLSLVFAAGQGDKGERGLNQLAYEGLIKKAIGGYWALTPKLGDMAMNNKIEAYNFPQGVVSHLYRAIAGKKSGVLSSVGLNTFVDPRQTGGRLNERTKDNLVQLVEINNQEELFYPSFPIDCALLRGTKADKDGNISMIDEASFQDNLAQAQAVKNSGGIVIVQVKEIVDAGSLPAHEIRIPGILVDHIVVVDESQHWQTYGEQFNRLFTGITKAANEPDVEFTPLDAKKIIARRAYLEILKHDNPVINLGIGTPEYVSKVAFEEGKTPFTLTVESGAIGGYPAGGMSFGASIGPDVILEQASQFDLYDGGGIDIAFLSFGEIDQDGNVNVSRLGENFNGIGGFVNISQASKRLVFCGALTAKGLSVECQDGELYILQEGGVKKFVNAVKQINFNADFYGNDKAPVMYITERAVFEYIDGAVTLTEVAPGVDIEKDILAHCEFLVTISPDLKEMDACIFHEAKMLNQSGESLVANN